MGDLKRYDLELSDNRCDCGNARSIDETECEHGDYVRHSDHVVYLNEMKLERDAALAREAALREELAKPIGGRILGELHSAEITKLRSELAAAEQRNAELVELLRECISLPYRNGLLESIIAAINPAESGASHD